MYHRINIPDTDPWNICVSPANFEEHIKFVKDNFNVVSSGDVFKQVTTGKIIEKSICITFDDGYADNYINAKPILEKYSCPATFFIPTAFINQITSFWWDELEMILLHSKKLPARLLLQIGAENYEYTLAVNELTQQQWMEHIHWRWYKESPTDRCKMFLDIWKKLRPLSCEEIKTQMAEIKKWACSSDQVNNDRLPMNKREILEIAANNLFSVSMHTHTHPHLEGKEREFQLQEILRCKKVLSDTYCIESNMLAYPYGAYDDHTISVVKEAKIDVCFTTEAVKIDANADPCRLGRYQAGNWDISTFKQQLDGWGNAATA